MRASRFFDFPAEMDLSGQPLQTNSNVSSEQKSAQEIRQSARDLLHDHLRRGNHVIGETFGKQFGISKSTINNWKRDFQKINPTQCNMSAPFQPSDSLLMTVSHPATPRTTFQFPISSPQQCTAFIRFQLFEQCSCGMNLMKH